MGGGFRGTVGRAFDLFVPGFLLYSPLILLGVIPGGRTGQALSTAGHGSKKKLRGIFGGPTFDNAHELQ